MCAVPQENSFKINYKSKSMTKDIILVIIVLAGIVSFFYNPLNTDMKYLQILMGGIVGFYVGIKEMPLGGQVKALFGKK